MGGYGLAQRGISIDALNDDIRKLTAAFQAQLAQNPHDTVIQTKFKALMDLQNILQTQNLPQEQLVLVKNQIAELAVNMRAPPAQTSTPVSLPNPVAVAPPPVAAPKVSLDSLFGSGALAAIMARSSATPQAPTPQPPAVPVPSRTPPPQKPEPQKTAPAPAPAPTDPMALMNMLRQAGILPPVTPAAGATPSAIGTPSTTLPFPLPLPGMNRSVQPAVPGTLEALTSDITLKAGSLKQYVQLKNISQVIITVNRADHVVDFVHNCFRFYSKLRGPSARSAEDASRRMKRVKGGKPRIWIGISVSISAVTRPRNGVYIVAG